MANGSWRLARTRGGAHLPLLIVAALAVVLIFVGKAQSSLFDNIRATVTDVMSPFLKATSARLDGINRDVRAMGGIFTVYQDNLRLKEENARLRKWKSTAEILNDRIKRYQLLLHAAPDPAMSSVVARVIGRSNHPFLQTMILDAGKAAGIKPGQAVIDDRGMIGRIFITGERTSWVIPLTDLDSRIPVTIVPGEAQAIMAGNNSPMPVIETLSHGVELKTGAQVMSSGDGDILPAGLPIGMVVAYGKTYRVALFADPSTVEDVQIMHYKLPIEQPHTPGPRDLPVTAAGLPPAAAPPPISPPVATTAPAVNAPKSGPVSGAQPSKPADAGNGLGKEADQGVE